MFAKFVALAVAAALLGVVLADNSGCPHPVEAKNLILQEFLVAPASSEGRHIIDVEVPKQILGLKDISCITIVSRAPGSTPDYVSFGRNKNQGYSIIVHSRLRNPLNSTLFVYGL